MKSTGIIVAAAIALVGCATSSTQMRTFHIAGGQQIELPMDGDAAKSVENADVRIDVTGYFYDGAKKEIIYTFGFTEKNGQHPREVIVEDVTGTTSEVLVSDLSPQLSNEGYWKGNAAPRRRGDSGLSWLGERGDTAKVFRFRIITGDGRELIMHQASIWSGETKTLIREDLARSG